jgi:hypothetical protein
MTFDQRLPVVNGDDGQWGDMLNQFIKKEHHDTGLNDAKNGGHQTITIQPGTTTPGSAPLKFFSGALLTNPEVGAVEFKTDRLYFTGSSRKTIAAYDDTNGAAGDLYYRDAGTNIVRLGLGSVGQGLSVTSSTPVWVATTNVSFETVSKNLNSYPFTLNYSGSVLISIIYTVNTNTITKTLNYTTGVLTSVVLSGSGLPTGISLTKTLSYSANTLNSVSYA